MSGLIKWRGKPEDVSEPKRMIQLVRREASREIETRNPQARHELTPPPALPAAGAACSLVTLPQDIELPRYCTIYDGESSLARYGLQNGRYAFNTSIELTSQQKSRYSPENTITLPSVFEPQAERCGCCGAWSLDGTVGAVWCPLHNDGRGAWVCYGRTSRVPRLFTCCDSCGFSGLLTHQVKERVGLVPGRLRGNFGTQF
jgi:hypothetical protein